MDLPEIGIAVPLREIYTSVELSDAPGEGVAA